MVRRFLCCFAAPALLLLVAPAWSEEPEGPGGLVRGILREIGAAVEPCPQEVTDAFVDREVVCGVYAKGYSQFRLDWDTSLDRYDVRSRLTPASPWALRAGRYVRDYEAGDLKLTVAFDAESGRLVTAFTLPDPGPENGPPVPGGVTSAGSAPRAGVAMAGFGGVSLPLLIPESRVEPALPRRAAEMGIRGVVTLQVLVRRDGSVGEVRVLRVEPPGWGFEEAASNAVGQWRYEPARREGEPVDAWFTVLYEFEPR